MCTNLYIPEEEIQPSNVINQWRIRGGRAGRAPPPPLKFEKHMLYNVN